MNYPLHLQLVLVGLSCLGTFRSLGVYYQVVQSWLILWEIVRKTFKLKKNHLKLAEAHKIKNLKPDVWLKISELNKDFRRSSL